jgi:hypothetical protein
VVDSVTSVGSRRRGPSFGSGGRRVTDKAVFLMFWGFGRLAMLRVDDEVVWVMSVAVGMKGGRRCPSRSLPRGAINCHIWHSHSRFQLVEPQILAAATSRRPIDLLLSSTIYIFNSQLQFSLFTVQNKKFVFACTLRMCCGSAVPPSLSHRTPCPTQQGVHQALNQPHETSQHG